MFNNEMQVITRYCDYLNSNEVGHYGRKPYHTLSYNKAKLWRPLYVINDAVKSIMSVGSIPVEITLSQNDSARLSNERAVYNIHNAEVLDFDVNSITFKDDDIVDFGETLQHFSETQLLNMFNKCFEGIVGFGYVYEIPNESLESQEVLLGNKFLGLVRNIMNNGQSHMITKFGDKVTGFRYRYLSGCSDQILMDVDKNAFILELKQIDCYKLINLNVKRYVIIKRQTNNKCFDFLFGDDMFKNSQKGEMLIESLLKGDESEKILYRIGCNQSENCSSTDFDLPNTQVREVKDAIVLRHKVKGRIYDNYQDYITHVPVTSSIRQIKVSKKVLNKVTVNFINAPKLTSQLIKSNLGYINNNIPEIDIINEAIPALMYAIKDTLCVENCLLASLSSKETQFINLLKENKVELAPTSVIQAFKAGKLMSYLDYKIRGLFGVNDVSVIDSAHDTKLDFH